MKFEFGMNPFLQGMFQTLEIIIVVTYWENSVFKIKLFLFLFSISLCATVLSDTNMAVQTPLLEIK